MEHKQLYWEDIEIGQEIPTSFSLKLNLARVMLQVSGSQGYYPIHYDRDFARAAGVPDVFFNTQFLTAALGRLISDWIGIEGWLQKFRLEIRKQNSLGETMTVKGKVTNKYIQDGVHYVEADVWCETPEKGITTPCKATVIFPSRS